MVGIGRGRGRVHKGTCMQVSRPPLHIPTCTYLVVRGITKERFCDFDCTNIM